VVVHPGAAIGDGFEVPLPGAHDATLLIGSRCVQHLAGVAEPDAGQPARVIEFSFDMMKARSADAAGPWGLRR
jgi:hypothetical protein